MTRKLIAGVLASFICVVAVKLASSYTEAVATRFNDVKVEDLKLDDGDIVDTDGTARLTLGSSSPHLALTGETYLQLRLHATPDASIDPDGAGQLVVNTTSGDVCISTGSSAGAWVLLRATSTACQN